MRFPFNLETDFLTAEIPYGNKKRNLIAESYFEKGKWEFPAQKYVDISESDLGATILNNSKYGFSSNKKGIHLSLLRTPPRASSVFYSYLNLVPKKERTKYVDVGKNSTEYGLWIHEGDFIRSCAWKKGYEYNYPLIFERFRDSNFAEFTNVDIKDEFRDVLKEDFTFIFISNPNVILQAIKVPEKKLLDTEKSSVYQDENNKILILRLFETSGNPQQEVEIQLIKLFRILKVIETDLLEREIYKSDNSSIKIEDFNKFYLDFKMFEIKTIKLFISIKK